MTVICAKEGMPTPRTIRDWADEDKDIASAIARGREIGYDAIAEQALAIADDGRNDTFDDADGNPHVDTDVIQRSKLRVETRLKLLAKWCPKKYGEQQMQTNVNVGVSMEVQPVVINIPAQLASPRVTLEDAEEAKELPERGE